MKEFSLLELKMMNIYNDLISSVALYEQKDEMRTRTHDRVVLDFILNMFDACNVKYDKYNVTDIDPDTLKKYKYFYILLDFDD